MGSATVSVLNESKTVNHVVTSTDGIFSTESVVDENYNTVMTTITDKNGKSFSTYTKYIGSMPKKVVDYRGAATVYTYDFEDEETPESAMFGNTVSTKKYSSEEATSYISNEAEYDSETGLIVKEINERGKETTYSYTNGEYLTEKVTFPNSLSYEYSYNSLNSNIEKITADNATSSVTSDDISNEFGYIGRLLTETSHNGFDFRYAYDELGRLKGVKINATSLLDISYANNSNGTTSSTTVYANNTSSEVISDSRGKPISKKVNGTQTSAAEYDECGNIKKLIDNIKGICYNYYYNSNGKIIKIEERNVSTNVLVNTRTFTYDSCQRTLTASNTATGQQYCPVYEADSNSNKYPDNAVKGMTLTGKYTDVVVKDGFNRPFVHELTLDSASSPLITDSYMYLGSGNSYTNYVYRITHNAGNGNEYLFYTYDANGNINSVSDNTSVDHPWFTYDKFGRLSGEGLPKLNLERTYTYDDGGNMIGKVEKNTATGAVTTHSFLYSSLAWKDQLVCYDGNCITYDAIGNPTCYKGNALTWTNIRHLSSYGNNTFAYGADGIRCRKNNITYTLDGNKILKETDGTNTTVYYYGASGIIGFNYNGTDYYFRKNLQGDVITIYTANGTKAATYIYDAWGKVLDVTNYTSDNIGDINPIRYRGYYYDTETELYYLESRYYDPETCRFINADTIDYLDPETIGGLNLFAYCNNNLQLRSLGHNLGTNFSSPTYSNTSSGSSDIPTKNMYQKTSSTPFANVVSMTNRSTTIIDNPILGMIFGNISYITTTQHNNAGTVYVYTNIGNSTSSAGLGFNFKNRYGASAYVSSNIGLGANIQFSPYATFGSEISVLDGLSFSLGTISGNTTKEITGSVGWGTLGTSYAICKIAAVVPIPGARAAAAVAACIIVLIDIFN